MKSVLRLLIVSLCFVLLLCSCSNEQAGGQNVADVTAAEGELGVPLAADFGGEEYRVLSAGNVTYVDFNADEESSMPLDVAQYKRKALVESNYNIEILEDVKTSYSSGNGPGFKILYNSANSGTAEYNVGLIAGYNLSQSWWDQKANEALTIHDIVFFTSGNFSLANNDAAYVIMFNKKLLEDYNLSNPYEMVANNEWTLENFGKLCKEVTEDLNNDGTMDENDRYGLLVWVDSLLGMVNAAGQRCCVINDDDEIVLSLYNETTLDAVDRYLAIALDKQYAIQYQSVKGMTQEELEKKLWSGNQGLFWTTYMGSVPKFREMESDFGLLPYPKLTATLSSYAFPLFKRTCK